VCQDQVAEPVVHTYPGLPVECQPDLPGVCAELNHEIVFQFAFVAIEYHVNAVVRACDAEPRDPP
jgi:hypothetical protein